MTIAPLQIVSTRAPAIWGKIEARRCYASLIIFLLGGLLVALAALTYHEIMVASNLHASELVPAITFAAALVAATTAIGYFAYLITKIIWWKIAQVGYQLGQSAQLRYPLSVRANLEKVLELVHRPGPGVKISVTDVGSKMPWVSFESPTMHRDGDDNFRSGPGLIILLGGGEFVDRARLGGVVPYLQELLSDLLVT